jgi:hypothetical protein
LVFDYALADLNPSELLHYYFYALCNMVTFHAPRCSDLTIMVDNLRIIVVFEHCLCVMFVFQLGSLHIYKDVSYDYNNFVSSSLYQIPTTSRNWPKCNHYIYNYMRLLVFCNYIWTFLQLFLMLVIFVILLYFLKLLEMTFLIIIIIFCNIFILITCNKIT